MMLMMGRIHAGIITSLAAAYLFASTAPALASTSGSGTGMPWETPLNQILQSIQGPVAKVIATIIIIVTGLSLAFGDGGSGFRKLIQIVFGLSIAFTAGTFFLPLFGFAGGALI
jgi:type IV secretion system protein VirB2